MLIVLLHDCWGDEEQLEVDFAVFEPNFVSLFKGEEIIMFHSDYPPVADSLSPSAFTWHNLSTGKSYKSISVCC